jgi:hypothetical protein
VDVHDVEIMRKWISTFWHTKLATTTGLAENVHSRFSNGEGKNHSRFSNGTLI